MNTSELLEARERLTRGDVVAIPTETVYGLAASIESEAGLRKIFALKERPFFDPLIVHIASLKQAAAQTTEWTPLADYLARIFWPGPLTLVLKKAPHVHSLITSGLDTVAIRYPAHPVARELIQQLGSPIAAPSANKFGRTSPSSAAHVRDEFPDPSLLILDGGPCEVGIESTVIALEESADPSRLSRVRILRPGGISAEMLRETLEKWSRPTEVVFNRKDPAHASPGHLEHHYMPKIPLIISPVAKLEALPAEQRMRIRTTLGHEAKNTIELHLDEDPVIAARELYEEMRTAASSGAEAIVVCRQGKSDGLWVAIWDRLERAASLNLAE